MKKAARSTLHEQRASFTVARLYCLFFRPTARLLFYFRALLCFSFTNVLYFSTSLLYLYVHYRNRAILALNFLVNKIEIDFDNQKEFCKMAGLFSNESNIGGKSVYTDVDVGAIVADTIP